MTVRRDPDKSPAERAADDLREIRDWWPELLADVEPGTARHWQQREHAPPAAVVDMRCPECRAPRMLRVELDPKMAVLGRRLFCPRCDRAGSHGASPAPGRVDVMDAATAIRVGVWELAGMVAHELRRRGPDRLTVIPTVDWLLAQLPAVGNHGGDLLDAVAAAAARLELRLRSALGRPERIGRLWVVDGPSGRRTAVRCPECSAASLLVLHDRALIVCANPRCGREWREDAGWAAGTSGWRWLAQTLSDQLQQRREDSA